MANNFNILDQPGTGAISSVSSATVATAETTTSGTYADLATPGPAVTATVPSSGKVKITLTARAKAGTNATAEAWMGVALTGANTVVADQLNALAQTGPTNNQASFTFLLTGLSPGSTTFTAKYRLDGADTNGTFANRFIVVETVP